MARKKFTEKELEKLDNTKVPSLLDKAVDKAELMGETEEAERLQRRIMESKKKK